MSIPKTTGYNEIVKIAEAALKGDKEMAKKYITTFDLETTSKNGHDDVPVTPVVITKASIIDA